MNTVSISDDTCERVYERDGYKCWLCDSPGGTTLEVAHHIDAAAEFPFAMFRDNGTIPHSINKTSHFDNIFPLCAHCHIGYGLRLTFPKWIIVPDEETIRKYIDHEKSDYEDRCLISKTLASRCPIPPRTLPLIDRSKVLYYPLFITQNPSFTKKILRLTSSNWPKSWLGEPTTTIHRAACRGLWESTPVKPITLGRRNWQSGVPQIFQVLIGELINLWGRPIPKRPILKRVKKN